SARAARRSAQLGLSVLLAARRQHGSSDLAAGRISRGGGRLASVADARYRRPATAIAAGLLRFGRPPLGRMGNTLAPRLRELQASESRERRLRAAAARLLRRGARRFAPWPPFATCPKRGELAI